MGPQVLARHVLARCDLKDRPEILLGLAGFACEHDPMRAVLNPYVSAGHHSAVANSSTTREDAKGPAFYVARAPLAIEDTMGCMAVERLKAAWLLAMG